MHETDIFKRRLFLADFGRWIFKLFFGTTVLVCKSKKHVAWLVTTHPPRVSCDVYQGLKWTFVGKSPKFRNIFPDFRKMRKSCHN
jgi:hypothetical protein